MERVEVKLHLYVSQGLQMRHLTILSNPKNV